MSNTQQQNLQKQLDDLLKLPENKDCADCGSKAPRWASTNLGIFFCIRCSGIHRSMGTHISKVKSVSLDKWTPELVDNMKTMGNANAKAIYEASVPPGYPRGDIRTDNYALEQWIRDKYEHKKYMAGEAGGFGSRPSRDENRYDSRREDNRYNSRENSYNNNYGNNNENTGYRQGPGPATTTAPINTSSRPTGPAPAGRSPQHPPPSRVAAPGTTPPKNDLLDFSEPAPKPTQPQQDLFGDFVNANTNNNANVNANVNTNNNVNPPPRNTQNDISNILSLYNTPMAPNVVMSTGQPMPGQPQRAYPQPNYNMGGGMMGGMPGGGMGMPGGGMGMPGGGMGMGMGMPGGGMGMGMGMPGGGGMGMGMPGGGMGMGMGMPGGMGMGMPGGMGMGMPGGMTTIQPPTMIGTTSTTTTILPGGMGMGMGMSGGMGMGAPMMGMPNPPGVPRPVVMTGTMPGMNMGMGGSTGMPGMNMGMGMGMGAPMMGMNTMGGTTTYYQPQQQQVAGRPFGM